MCKNTEVVVVIGEERTLAGGSSTVGKHKAGSGK